MSSEKPLTSTPDVDVRREYAPPALVRHGDVAGHTFGGSGGFGEAGAGNGAFFAAPQ